MKSDSNSAGGPMRRTEKALLEKSVEVIMEKAEDCLDLAKTQHEIADQQHAIADQQQDSADKLDTLGHALIAEAIDLKGEMEIVAARVNPHPQDPRSDPPTIPK